MSEKKLTPRQARFVSEYLIDLNATQAAIRAGYSAKTASQIGEQNLRKLEIQKAIQKAQEKRAERTEITQDRVLAEIAKIAFGNIQALFDKSGNLLPIAEMTPDAAAMIAGFEASGIGEDMLIVKKVKVNDRLKALEMIGRHLGIFKDKLELTGRDGKDLLPPDPAAAMAALLKGIDVQEG